MNLLCLAIHIKIIQGLFDSKDTQVYDIVKGKFISSLNVLCQKCYSFLNLKKNPNKFK